jgi:hypothetical protein
MTDEFNDIECAALEMIKRFPSAAAQIAREFSEIAEERHHDQLSAKIWRDIAAAIERVLLSRSAQIGALR